MRIKQILNNIITSAIIGVILGIITECALILNVGWLIKITQSFLFWGFIICISAFLSKDYFLSLINSSIIMAFMNCAYYIFRLIKSGYTNMGGWQLFTLTGIAGSIYLGTFVFLIKKIIIHCKMKCIVAKYTFIFMTIIGIAFTIYGFKNYAIFHNLFYNIDIGIIIGFAIGLLIAKLKDRN